LFLSILHNTKL